MKKLFVILSLLMLTIPAFAGEKGETYLGPVLGYHFFDDGHELDDKVEGGLRLGYYWRDDHSVELEGDYTKTDYDRGGDKSATSLSINCLKYFDITPNISPFIFVGAGGLFHEDSMSSLVAGAGARFTVTDLISFDFRVKDMYHSKGRNDIIPSLSMNFHFGKKGTPAPEPAVEEPKDADGDGVLDGDDLCPKTPKGYPVNNAGCTPDNDKDGVYDFQDKCPTTPEGQPVDETGCTPDTDGDGVYDFEDKCPNTMAGVKVNSAGCFVSATLNVNFKTNSAEIEESYLDEIRKFAVFMKTATNINVEIQGHTDSKGDANYNKSLSQKRAEAVVSMLVKKYGVAASRLTAVGYGEEKPVVPNDTPENMRKNRRIDTVVR